MTTTKIHISNGDVKISQINHLKSPVREGITEYDLHSNSLFENVIKDEELFSSASKKGGKPLSFFQGEIFHPSSLKKIIHEHETGTTKFKVMPIDNKNRKLIPVMLRFNEKIKTTLDNRTEMFFRNSKLQFYRDNNSLLSPERRCRNPQHRHYRKAESIDTSKTPISISGNDAKFFVDQEDVKKLYHRHHRHYSPFVYSNDDGKDDDDLHNIRVYCISKINHNHNHNHTTHGMKEPDLLQPVCRGFDYEESVGTISLFSFDAPHAGVILLRSKSKVELNGFGMLKNSESFRRLNEDHAWKRLEYEDDPMKFKELRLTQQLSNNLGRLCREGNIRFFLLEDIPVISHPRDLIPLQIQIRGLFENEPERQHLCRTVIKASSILNIYKTGIWEGESVKVSIVNFVQFYSIENHCDRISAIDICCSSLVIADDGDDESESEEWKKRHSATTPPPPQGIGSLGKLKGKVKNYASSLAIQTSTGIRSSEFIKNYKQIVKNLKVMGYTKVPSKLILVITQKWDTIILKSFVETLKNYQRKGSVSKEPINTPWRVVYRAIETEYPDIFTEIEVKTVFDLSERMRKNRIYHHQFLKDVLRPKMNKLRKESWKMLKKERFYLNEWAIFGGVPNAPEMDRAFVKTLLVEMGYDDHKLPIKLIDYFINNWRLYSLEQFLAEFKHLKTEGPFNKSMTLWNEISQFIKERSGDDFVKIPALIGIEVFDVWKTKGPASGKECFEILLKRLVSKDGPRAYTPSKKLTLPSKMSK